MNLETIRGEINALDEELLELFERRSALTAQVAGYKKQHGMAVFQPEREQQILQRVGSQATDPQAAEAFFSAVMDISKVGQSKLLGDDGSFRQFRQHVVDALPAPRGRIACQGVPGAYSHKAAKTLFGAGDIVFYESFKETAQAVADGAAECCVMPIENSLAGTITETYDAMDELGLSIIAAVEIPVHHCLLAKQGTALSDVRRVLSHKAAISQCRGFYRSHPDVVPQVFSNTAAAAKFVAECPDADVAAIASADAAHLYGLSVLLENVEDNTTNTTRFVVLSKTPYVERGAGRVSVKFILPHRKGELYRILLQFAAAGLNLQKIESRPTRAERFTVAFFMDFDGSILTEDTMALLCSLKGRMEQMKVLGSYKIYSDS